jgi:hypothetical protein
MAADDETVTCEDYNDFADTSLADIMIHGGDDGGFGPQQLGGGNDSDDGSGFGAGVTGGGRSYKSDHSAPVMKDKVIELLIPDAITECALYLEKHPGEPCSSADTLQAVATAIGVIGNAGGNTAIMDAAKIKLHCDTEKCVLMKLKPQLGPQRVSAELATAFKLRGPIDSQLLNNVNIDRTLAQWALRYRDFFPYNFNMVDYANHSFVNGEVVNRPDTLATISFADLYTGAYNGTKYRRAACVINSDVSHGGGKHWMALFVRAGNAAKLPNAATAPNPGVHSRPVVSGNDVASANETCSVEFFNSSGNAPAPEWVNWMQKTRDQMEALYAGGLGATSCTVNIVKVTTIRHQQSRSECGLYSLFYIWARLHDVPIEYFTTTPIPDQLMFEFRQHLFETPATMKSFDWSKFLSRNRVKWE